MPEEIRPKEPNLADLRTMAGLGYRVMLTPEWLRWIVDQADTWAAVCHCNQPDEARLASHRRGDERFCRDTAEADRD